jgi:hypothetical protein
VVNAAPCARERRDLPKTFPILWKGNRVSPTEGRGFDAVSEGRPTRGDPSCARARGPTRQRGAGVKPTPRRAEGRGLEPRCGCPRRFSSSCEVSAVRCFPLQFVVTIGRWRPERLSSFAFLCICLPRDRPTDLPKWCRECSGRGRPGIQAVRRPTSNSILSSDIHRRPSVLASVSKLLPPLAPASQSRFLSARPVVEPATGRCV